MKCNWKVFVDNYLDGGYHVEYAHKALASNLDTAAYHIEVNDLLSLQSCTGNDESSRVGGNVLYAFIYPNLMLNFYGGWLDINIVEPIDGERCRVKFLWFLNDEKADFGETDRNSYIEQAIEASDLVQQEDIELCENVQDGLRCSAFDFGRYVPSIEFPMHRFHQLLQADYTRFLTSADDLL